MILNKSNKIVYNSFESINNLFNLTDNGLKTISVGNSINPNLGSIFVHNRKSTLNNFNYFSKPCILINCKVCEFLYIRDSIKFNKDFCLPIQNESDCNSIGCIYIIYCNLCNCYYIGETGKSLKVRLKQHIYKIKTFVPYEGAPTEISTHFNLNGHNYLNHLSVFIYKSEIMNKLTRLNLESELIHFYLLTGNKVLNSRLMSNITEFFTS